MRIKLPKELRGVTFPKVTTIELNGFDIDLLLPSVFFRILAEGSGRARRANDPTLINDYVRSFATHSDMVNFDDPFGERLLHRLVRTALATTGRVGQKKHTEQIIAVAPYSVLSHKTGLPSESSRQRNVDTFLYEALRERSGSELALRQFVCRVFGRGVVVDRLPQLGGRYDGVTELDTLTRLSLAFLDGFQPTAAGRSLRRSWSEACPALVSALGWDLQHYLHIYHQRMPPQALTYHLLALISLEVFIYTLKLVHGINALVHNPAVLPPSMWATISPSPPDLYVDFTAEPGGLSQQMAVAGVRRDLDAYGQFLTSAVILRLLDRYATKLGQNARIRSQIEPMLGIQQRSAPEYLQALLQLAEDPRLAMHIYVYAQADEEAIRELNRKVAVDEEQAEDNLGWMDALLPEHLSPLQRVITLVVESQSRAVKNFGDWYRGAGGLVKPYGILAGVPTGRRAWRYQPSNDLLAVWVQLASIQPRDGEPVAAPRPVPLREFLAYLHHRFGILVDRPPAPYSGAEAVAAARDNLRAMLRRLRQMGIFRDLSDDFTVQELQPLYATTEVAS